jgi:diacylglycerol kinase (ATP)
MKTKKAGDTYTYALTIDLTKYSMLVAAGGDGSYHEVVNGMLARPDGIKLPIGMIPNGSGNDTCHSIGVETIDHALDYICAREVVSVDTIRCLIDVESEAQIHGEEERKKHCRHMLINASLSLPALVAKEAAKFKTCCGKLCYTIATLEQALLGKIRQELFDIEVDGVKVSNEG